MERYYLMIIGTIMILASIFITRKVTTELDHLEHKTIELATMSYKDGFVEAYANVCDIAFDVPSEDNLECHKASIAAADTASLKYHDALKKIYDENAKK